MGEAAHLRLAHKPRLAPLASGPVQRHLHLAAGVAAEHGTIVDERDAQSVPRRRKRRAESARTRPHHDEVKRPAVRDLVAVAREALTLRRKRLGFLRRHVRKVGREEERVAARHRAGEIDKLDVARAGVERELARLLPHPALATRRAERAAALAGDLDRELAGRELRQPVLRARPHAPRSCARDRDLRGRRGNGLQNARREQVRAPHLMRELRIDHPSAVVREVLRLQPHESRHLLLRFPRRRAEIVVHVLTAGRNALGRIFARNDVRLLARILQRVGKAWQVYGRRRALWYRHLHLDASVHATPCDADVAARDGVAHLYPVESRQELRRDGERLESRRRALDTAERAVEPVHDVRHHEVVERRSFAAVPRLVAGRVALRDHVPVAGLRRVRRHLEDHVAAAVLGKHLEKIRIADLARADRTASAHVLHDVGDDRRRLGGIGKPERERHRVRRLRIILVVVTLRIPPLRVERLLDVRGLLAECGRLVLLAKDVGALRERRGVEVVEGRRGEVDGRPAERTLLGGDCLLVPVAEAAGRDELPALLVLRLCADVFVVGDHVRPVGANERRVAGPLVLLPRNLDQRRTPFDRMAEPAPEHGVLRRDVGNHPVGELRIGKIHARLREHRVRVPAPADLVGVDVVLLLPAELLAVRTVREHALHVGALRPPADVVNLVQKLDRAFEGARTRRVRHHHARRRGNNLR